jgi:hypothetical protein
MQHLYHSFLSITKESETVPLKADDPRRDIVRRDCDLEKERINGVE